MESSMELRVLKYFLLKIAEEEKYDKSCTKNYMYHNLQLSKQMKEIGK